MDNVVYLNFPGTGSFGTVYGKEENLEYPVFISFSRKVIHGKLCMSFDMFELRVSIHILTILLENE